VQAVREVIGNDAVIEEVVNGIDTATGDCPRVHLIRGRLNVTQNVRWGNRCLITGGRPITSRDVRPPYEIGCFYVDGKVVDATAEDVIAYQEEWLEQQRLKRASNAALRQVREQPRRVIADIHQQRT